MSTIIEAKVTHVSSLIEPTFAYRKPEQEWQRSLDRMVNYIYSRLE